MATDMKHEFWNRLDKVQAGMLTAEGARPVPMSPYADPDANAIWFITADGTDIAQAAAGGSRVSLTLADSGSKIYATIDGAMALSDDKAKLDELWSPIAGAWFDEGKEDKDVRLVRMTPARAEVWATDGAAGFLYEIAKANLTGEQPDMGEHARITF
ncbi:pyridoxamine 5'-phosphate oxidase family protein [Seohaeicola zhoushanensis]|uniref:General stress protein FMN-binding split barrel domain-containing protein n=1 Tax=Seohaeicola zhoushanensis TaxID=1569283 RepID=A0A8J3M6K2_9RHOB|nr:pyridoxamine 5'-phosphate oxidase family protein [Seohaeicola zhoushanensis]GHF47505.1 hypothetical protein GCM10017056_19120 [Seohaeicola zhoushanensis]